MEFNIDSTKNISKDNLDEKVIDTLKIVFKELECSEKTQINLVNNGGQGLIFKIITHGYKSPLLIKIPYYKRHKNHTALEHSILKEGKVSEFLMKSEIKCFPDFIYYDENGKYFVREFIDGDNLHNYLYKCDIEQRKILLIDLYEMTKKVFDLFHDNSTESYVIRDYKLKNIIIDKNNKIYLIDYGSCRPEKNMISLTRTNSLKRMGGGAFLHWPIEQLCEDIERCDRRVDYFAWGVMSYYVLFLDYPYKNIYKDVATLKSEYLKSYELAKDKIKNQFIAGNISEKMMERIILALNPDCQFRRFR